MESLDRLFDVFSKERRRYALYALEEADEPIGIEELAERVRRWEEEGAGEDDTNSAGQFDEVALSLKHTHLPKASQAEYIEYDREANEIRISGEPAEFQIVLAVSEAFEGPGRPFVPDDITPEEFLSELTATGRGD